MGSTSSSIRRRLALGLLLGAWACGDAPANDGGPDAGPSGAVSTPDMTSADVGVQADLGVAAVSDAGPMETGPASRTPNIDPLFGPDTPRAAPLIREDGRALITRFADRGRDRHAREDQFQAYEHYLPLYWENRTAQIEISDPIARGGDTIRFRVQTEWPLQVRQAELRLFFRGLSTVAEYFDNRPMTVEASRTYRHEVDFNSREGRPLQVGDRMEFELSQFLQAPPRGRTNYYGTTFLYIVGQGLAPWSGEGPRRDSAPLPERARLGGGLTIHENESNEPAFAFSQMPTLLAPEHAQPFVRGRRLVHTNFETGRHDESDTNPVWTEQSGKLGPGYIQASCHGCHPRNGRALPPLAGGRLDGYTVKVANAEGGPDPRYGRALQTQGPATEGFATLVRWDMQGRLRRPVFDWGEASPVRASARISPGLVGMGLLEAIPESAIQALADPEDTNGDGISGRVQVVRDVDGRPRLGRFGWKAGQPTVRGQTAGALHTDMGVLTSLYPEPDCGVGQTGCGPSGAELSDADLDDLTDYVALLGVPPQRGFDRPEVVAGKQAFVTMGCESCHVSTFTTSPFTADSEVRSQSIHPYTDLLLHDMGPDLADALPEGRASGAEWRTPPLWGLGRTAGVSEGEAYLHDGRARTMEEAILWHGGEGRAAKEAFERASPADQSAVLAFLRSL